MWELDHKEGWVLNNQYFQTLVLENTLESPLDSREIKPVNPKGNQPWIFIGRTDAEAEAPILWPPDVKSQLIIGKDPDAEKDWQEEKGATEDEMDGWHHWLNGCEFEQAPEVNGQESLACYSPWDCKELDMTEWLNNSEINISSNCFLGSLSTRSTEVCFSNCLRGTICKYVEEVWEGKPQEVG